MEILKNPDTIKMIGEIILAIIGIFAGITITVKIVKNKTVNKNDNSTKTKTVNKPKTKNVVKLKGDSKIDNVIQGSNVNIFK